MVSPFKAALLLFFALSAVESLKVPVLTPSVTFKPGLVFPFGGDDVKFSFFQDLNSNASHLGAKITPLILGGEKLRCGSEFSAANKREIFKAVHLNYTHGIVGECKTLEDHIQIIESLPFEKIILTTSSLSSQTPDFVISMWPPPPLKEFDTLLQAEGVTRVGIVPNARFVEEVQAFAAASEIDVHILSETFQADPEILETVRALDLHHVFVLASGSEEMAKFFCDALEAGLAFPNVTWTVPFLSEEYWERETERLLGVCNVTRAILGLIELSVKQVNSEFGPFVTPTGAIAPIDSTQALLKAELLNALWLSEFAVESFVTQYGGAALGELMGHRNESARKLFRQTLLETEFVGVGGVPVKFHQSGRRYFNHTVTQRLSNGSSVLRGFFQDGTYQAVSPFFPFSTSGIPEHFLDALLPLSVEDVAASLGLQALSGSSSTAQWPALLEDVRQRVNKRFGETSFRMAPIQLYDTQCDTAVVSAQFWGYLAKRNAGNPRGIIGPLCPEAAKGVAMLDVSSDSGFTATFGFREAFISIVSSEERLVARSLLAVFLRFGWTRFFLVRSASTPTGLLETAFHRHKISILSSISVEEHLPFNIADNIASVGARIVVILTDAATAARALCQSHIGGIKRGTNFVWLLPSFGKGWLNKFAPSTNCTASQLRSIATNVITFQDWLYARGSLDDGIVTVGGETRKEWLQRQKGALEALSPHSELLHDLVWSYAFSVDETIRALGITAGRDPRLRSHLYSSHVSFFGMSGNVSFNSNRERESYIGLSSLFPNGTEALWGKVHSSSETLPIEIVDARAAPNFENFDQGAIPSDSGTSVWLWIVIALLCVLLAVTVFWLVWLYVHSKRQKREKELAEHVDRIKAVFMGNISHQLRTPLNGVRGLTQSLMRKLTKRKDHQECLKAINISSQHLESVIGAILDFTRLHGKGVDLHEEPCNVRDLLEQAALLTWLPRGHVSIFTRCDPKIGWIIGDATRIRQIVGNFIGNASKFTFSGKVVISAELRPKKRSASVTCGNVPWVLSSQESIRRPSPIPGSMDRPLGKRMFSDITAADASYVLSISVSDTGIGIPDQFQKQLFDEYFRIEARAEGAPVGTGLGLPISKKLATAMGGAIFCTSEEGVGTTFAVEIPFRPAQDPEVLTRAVFSAESLCSTEVIIVEHSKAGAQALREQLVAGGLVNLQIVPLVMAAKFLEFNNNSNNKGRVFVVHSLCGFPFLHAVVDKLQQPKLSVVFVQLRSRAVEEEPGSSSGSAHLTDVNSLLQDWDVSTEHGAFTLTEPVQSGQLRLAVARCLSYLHNSEPLDSILVTSQPPSSSSEEQTSMTGMQVRSALAALRVLVAEDNVINQRVICQSLKLCGVQEDNIVVAENGSLAFEQFAARASCPGNSFDICIIDVHMPVLNGLQLARKIHQSLVERPSPPAWKEAEASTDMCLRVKVLEEMYPWLVAHSASAMPEDQVRTLKAGFFTFLPKPLVWQDLRRLLEKICVCRILQNSKKEHKEFAKELFPGPRAAEEDDVGRNKAALRALRKQRLSLFRHSSM